MRETEAKHPDGCQCPACYSRCPAGGEHDFSGYDDWCSKCGTIWILGDDDNPGIKMRIPECHKIPPLKGAKCLCDDFIEGKKE